MGSYPAAPPQGVSLKSGRNSWRGFAARPNAKFPVTHLSGAGCLIPPTTTPQRPRPVVHAPHIHGAHSVEVVRDGRYVTLQMSEVGVSRTFSQIPSLSARLLCQHDRRVSQMRQPMVRLDGGIAVYVVARIGLVRPTERVSGEFLFREVGRNQNRLDRGNVTCTNGC